MDPSFANAGVAKVKASNVAALEFSGAAQIQIPANGNGTTAPDGAERTYNIAAVDRALDLLEALARIGPATLAALAEDAGMTRTAGFRLLRTMQARGFAIQDRARGLWRLVHLAESGDSIPRWGESKTQH